MKRKEIIWGLIFLGIGLTTASQTLACTCGGDMSPRGKFGAADIVFVGTVTDFTDDSATFQIERTYKGVLANPFVMYAKRTTTCDSIFVSGTKYLVYASEIAIDDRKVFNSTVCDGAEEYSDSDDDIRYLETPEKPLDVTITPRTPEKLPRKKCKRRRSRALPAG
jgi:hypothetical protein